MLGLKHSAVDGVRVVRSLGHGWRSSASHTWVLQFPHMTLQILKSREGQCKSAETGTEAAEKPLVPGSPGHQHLCLKLIKALELGQSWNPGFPFSHAAVLPARRIEKKLKGGFFPP